MSENLYFNPTRELTNVSLSLTRYMTKYSILTKISEKYQKKKCYVETMQPLDTVAEIGNNPNTQ